MDQALSWEGLLAAASVALRVPAAAGFSRATGFFIAPRIVATCAHVFEGDPDRREIEAVAGPRWFTLRAMKEGYVRSDDGLDVALLELAEESEPGHDYVLVSRELAEGDRLWTFGFPEGTYQGGMPASFECEGFSQRHPGAWLRLARLRGTPVGPGYSGSPVVNRRTGAVCGMLCTSDLQGSAHMLPIADILAQNEDVEDTHAEPELHQRGWLDRLNDTQVRAGGWRYPGPALRGYLAAALKAAERHPYPGIDPAVSPPPLSGVYVRPDTWAASGAKNSFPEGQKLPARTVFELPGNSVLIGGAGAGKSSLLWTAVASRIREWQSGQQINWVPICVQAADLVAARPMPEAIAGGVSDDLSALGLRQSWPAEMFAEPPFYGAEWLVLVDGLDELVSVGHRQAVMTKLAGIQDQDDPLFRFVVATRPLPEDESVIPPGWAPRSFELLPFTTSQFSEVATNWFGWLKPKEPADAVERFVAQVQERGLIEVARNPLMATMLCQLFAANPDASLPPGRGRIFDEFEDLLNRRQYGSAAGGIRYELIAALAPFGSVAEDAGHQLLARAPSLIGRLAWHRMSGGTASVMDLVDGWLADLKPNHVPVSFWRGVLRDLLRRSGVLQERADDFVFSHQTIAEHRAAKYVTADAVRSDAEFGKLFRQASWRDAQSYARFLVAAWSDRSDLPSALNRVVEKEGLDGVQFVASLRTDGIELPQELYNRSLDRLTSFAVDPELPEPDRRGAAETVLAADKTAGISLLASAVRARGLDTSYRIWALETLAGVRHRPSRGPAPRSVESALLYAMRSLVEHDDVNGRELIAFVTRDSSWPEQGREWAVEALSAVGRLADDVLEPLISNVRTAHPKADAQLIERAYDVAAYWHQGQKRKSGDPYISHPLAVATTLAQLGMNTETICAALLHDTVECTPYTLVELKDEFGKDVAALVDGVTKLDKGKYGEAAEAETIRKLVVAGARDVRDVRVWVIEFACRLHDMRTLRYLPREVQERRAREVLEIFAPLASRLGMNTFTWELEDLAFATLYPKRFDEIARLVSRQETRREAFMQTVIEGVTADLYKVKIKNKVISWPRHYYSIYREMIARNVGFDDIYDLVRIRVLVDSARECYAALGAIHGRWNPVIGRFKDYIAPPKFDMYQSLHTTVIGPGGKLVELQIRTWDMHRRAEYGLAAHWKDEKDIVARGLGQGARKTGGKQDEAMEMVWLRQLVDWQREAEDLETFLDSLRFDLAGAEVYVFTPRGELTALPQGATPIDFAYAIHTEVGHRTIGARVNGHPVALESTLNNYDTVEILISKEQEAGPNRDWLDFVKSARAIHKIRLWFSEERREVTVEAGMKQIARVMRKQGLPLQRLATGRALLAIARDLGYLGMSELYAEVGEGRISAQSAVTELVHSLGLMDASEELTETTLPGKPPQQHALANSVEVEGALDVSVRLSRCCLPVPGDEIRGLTTHHHGVSVHRMDCMNLAHLTKTQRERIVTVHWVLSDASLFQVAIQVEAANRTRLLPDVTTVLSVPGVTILSASVTTRRDRMVIGRFTLEMGDPSYLSHMLGALKSIEGVSKAFRINTEQDAN